MTSWSLEKPLFIVGPMGAGKSHIGRQLADLAALPFTDLDAYIEDKTDKTISGLFAELGEAAFRETEARSLRDLTGTGIVATGGGTPCFHGNMEWMNRRGYTLYLAASPELLTQRLEKERAHRPLLASLEAAAVTDFLRNMIQERSPYYERAQICFYQEHERVHSAKMICELIRQLPGTDW